VNIRTVIDQYQRPKPTEAQRQEFGAYMRAVTNPGVLLDDLERGVVTPEAVEVWEALHPEELAEVREMVMNEIRQRSADGEALDELEVRRLNSLMGYSDDGYTAAMQQNYEKASEPEEAPTRPPGAPVNMSKQLPTSADQARQGRY
jgi:hypothetical protein